MPKFNREMEIDAPVEKVWEALIDPNNWPSWFPGFDSVQNVSSVSEGGTFEWTDDEQTGKALIQKVEPLKRLEVLTQMGDDKDLHVFELRPSGGFLGLGADETKIEYTLDTLMGGGILGNFLAGGNPKDAIRVKKAVHLLRKHVESI